MADDGTVATTGGVQKWSFDGSTWTLRSRVTTISGGTASGFRGLAGVVTGSSVTLFATTSIETAANRLVAYVDSAASNAALSSTTGTTIATAATNTLFRGVAISAQ
ncbi:MAG: hypothetical protein RLZZ450_3272 [Pseudomonadota bacterium]